MKSNCFWGRVLALVLIAGLMPMAAHGETGNLSAYDYLCRLAYVSAQTNLEFVFDYVSDDGGLGVSVGKTEVHINVDAAHQRAEMLFISLGGAEEELCAAVGVLGSSPFELYGGTLVEDWAQWAGGMILTQVFEAVNNEGVTSHTVGDFTYMLAQPQAGGETILLVVQN